MKKLYCLIPLLILIGLALVSNAQFKLTGQVVNYTGNEELKINIPVVFGFYQQNSTDIPINKDGSFTITLPVNEKKMANLIFKRKFTSLLLTPSKNLNVHLNAKDSIVTLVGGSALAENLVAQKANIDEYPFFLASNTFNGLLLEQLKKQVLVPYFAQRDEKIKAINGSSISKADQLLLATEVKYIAYNYLNDLARTQLTNRATVDSLILEVFDGASVNPPISPAGPQFYAFIDNYVRFLETKAFAQIKREKIPSSQPIPYFGISLDSANIFVKKYSKAQWRFLGATQNLQAAVAEPYAYQQIVTAYDFKDYNQFKDLVAAFRTKFPQSKFIAPIGVKNAQLDQILSVNEKNEDIKIVENYNAVKSIYEIVKKFPGKIVYLDIWGTWCGPCKHELNYLPALKAKFKGKDVVFVYLDMDEDDKDAAWKDFIKANALSGIHLRKSRANIAPIWKELLANAEDKAEYYPQYFIFDRTGKLVVTKAKRPSNGDELYTQLNSVLIR